jgi:hypothetical protein
MYVILKILDFMSFHPKLEESGPENITKRNPLPQVIL